MTRRGQRTAGPTVSVPASASSSATGPSGKDNGSSLADVDAAEHRLSVTVKIDRPRPRRRPAGDA
jgi:hypothetical protein